MQQTTISSSTISTTSLASSSVAHKVYVSISLSYKVLHAYRHTITILYNKTSLSSCIARILRTSFSDNLHVPRTRVLPIALLWPPYVIGQAIIFLPCGFFFLSIFFFSSPNLSGRRLDVYHTSTHGCVPIANLECRSETCCTRLAGNSGPKNRQKFAIWAPSHNFVGLCLRN